MTPEPERIITNLHNQPPSDEQILADELAKNYASDVEEYQNAVRDESFLPESITCDEENGKYSDYDKKLSRLKAALESFRKKEKAPHSAKVAVIDSFFKSKTDKIKEIDERIGEKMKSYLKKKEDEKRRAAEAKAAEERAEAERKLKEAHEAQRAAEEAAHKQREEAERVQREAAAAQRRAEEEAAAARRKAEEEASALRAAAAEEQRKKQEEIDRLRLQVEKDKAAIAAAEEAKKQADRDAKQAERDAKATLEAAEKEAKDIQKELKSDLKEANAQLAAVTKEASIAGREAENALDDAARADKNALKLERKADGKSSDFSRTRGESSLSSTSDYWTGHMEDLNTLDLEVLRFHITLDALDKAIKSAVRAGQRQIKGASIYEETRLNNR